MSALETLWYAILTGVCLLAVANWRQAIYLGLVIDVLRDPVRKMCETQPVAITVTGALLWLAILFSALSSRQADLKSLWHSYPKLRSAFSLLLFALLPAAILSCISFRRGWLMAAIGGASYLIPAIGVFTGFAFLRKEQDALRFMKWYVALNSLMLISVPLEYFKWDVPGLGGIQFEWIRYREGYTVDLMSGWYRSPDIMGLHAAHVIVFGMLLAVRSRDFGRFGWLVPVLWAGFCVLVSGRRKMVGIPLVFLAVFLTLGVIYRVTRVNRLAGLAMIVALLGAGVAVMAWSPDESSEYTDFASSIFTEGLERSNSLIIEGTLVTLRQTGILGAGLGVATQGRHYAGVETTGGARGWQEDGVSRLFVEFGVPGVLCLLASLSLLLKSLFMALRSTPKKSNEVILQFGLVAIVAGDAASFAISHQQFSGDPISALIVTLLLGMILRVPLLASLKKSTSPVIGKMGFWNRKVAVQN